MVKQWKQSLEQSDILSDGTPFDGANIDAPISSAGQGVDWSALTPGGALSDGATISGSGYVLGGVVSGQADGSANDFGKSISIDVTIDGTTYELVESSVVDGPITGGTSALWRFDSNLDVTVNIDEDINYGSGRVTYVLD